MPRSSPRRRPRPRGARAVWVLLAFAAAGILAAPSGSAAVRPRNAAPARVLVSADEWWFTPSRRAVERGPVLVQLMNLGEDAHDLVLRRVDRRGRPTGAIRSLPETPAGELTEAETTLRRGRWLLYCSLPGHRRLGMRAALRVR